MPGSGHFLLGAFGRGAVWAVALPLLGLLLLSTMSLLGVLAVTVVALVGRIAPARRSTRH